MGSFWSEESIKWYADASAYTGFHQKLAQWVAPVLQPTDTLCDVGCGLGRLSIALAPFVREVLCVDIDEMVLANLQKEADRKGVSNLRVLHGDAQQITGEYAVMLMSFWGHKSGEVNSAALCRRLLVRVANQDEKARITPRGAHSTRSNVDSIEAELQAAGRPYRLRCGEVEFGQPMESEEEIKRFLTHYAGTAGEFEWYMRTRVERTGRQDFPFYIPNPKPVGVFFIDMAVRSGGSA